jgi:hypothetical protein
MRSVPTAVLLSICLAACGAPKEEAKPAAPPPPPPTLATFAGTWQTTSVVGDTKKDTVKSTMTGTADSTGWSLAFPGGPTVALKPSISGDSLVVQSAEYESVLRKGVKVSVRTASVLKDGMLEGSMEATYKTAKGSEVVKGTVMSMKAAPK